jgi:hypothetical protein
MRHQPMIDANKAGDGYNVLLDVERQLAPVVQERISDEGARLRDHQRVSVGRGARHHRRTQRMRGATAVLDHHLLAPQRRQSLTDGARDDVADAASRRRHDNGDRTARIGLGMCAREA